jgi:hypothetical protein
MAGIRFSMIGLGFMSVGLLMVRSGKQIGFGFSDFIQCVVKLRFLWQGYKARLAQQSYLLDLKYRWVDGILSL